MKVTHSKGCGKARKHAEGNPRWVELFGCPMIGTWNCSGRITGERPHIVDKDWRLWLCKVNGEYGYILKWEGSKKKGLEIYTKAEIPEAPEYELEIFDKMSEGEIKEFADALPSVAKFQGFSWGGRSDSKMVFDAIKKHIDFSGKRVLDIGCSTGYYSMACAKSGARVMGVDKNANTIGLAKKIQERIEGTDCPFEAGDVRKVKGYWDVILCLSVLHQVDPSYDKLDENIDYLKQHCKRLVVELITPALEGGKVPAPAGMKKILEYKHKVRATRAVWLDI